MADARLEHGDTGGTETLLDLFLEVLVDFARMAAQRDLVAGTGAVMAVVRIAGGHDLDRRALEVVDLELARLEVVDTQADGFLRKEGVGPAQPRLACRADVAAEQLQYDTVVRLHHEETAPEQHEEQGAHVVQRDQAARDVHVIP